MAVGLYQLRPPTFEGMRYNGPEDLEALRAWALPKDTEASESFATRIEPTDDGGFQFYAAWNWDPEQEFLAQRGAPGDWVVFYYGQFNVYSPELFAHDFMPPDPDTIPPEPEPEA
jgi:hypothetical protein